MQDMFFTDFNGYKRCVLRVIVQQVEMSLLANDFKVDFRREFLPIVL